MGEDTAGNSEDAFVALFSDAISGFFLFSVSIVSTDFERESFVASIFTASLQCWTGSALALEDSAGLVLVCLEEDTSFTTSLVLSSFMLLEGSVLSDITVASLIEVGC